MMDRCDHCPVIDGECYARRRGLRRMCDPAAGYLEYMAAWGPLGGPGSIPNAGRAKSFDEWDKLPTAVQEAARSCSSKRLEASSSGCGCTVTVCRGGSRDGQVVGRIDCGRCKAAVISGESIAV